MSQYAREDALNARQFEHLARATYDFDGNTELQVRFILHVAGRLGLRAGELAHFRADWLNEKEGTLTIPEHESCDFGADGGICGYCRSRAEDYYETRDRTVEEWMSVLASDYDNPPSEDVLREMAEHEQEKSATTMKDALSRRWEPKTEAGSRTVAYDFDVRTQLAVEDFTQEYDRWPLSKATVNRRVNSLADKSRVSENVYPHSLRATAASNHAKRDVSKSALMSTMGWVDYQTPGRYVAASAESAMREIRSKHR